MARTGQFDKWGNEWDDRGFWVNPKGQVWTDDGSTYGTWVDAPSSASDGSSEAPGPTFTFRNTTTTSSGGGGGGSDPTRYSQHTDGDGSVTGVPGTLYQLSSSGAMTIIRWGNTDKPAAGPDADGDGYDDRTGFPVGVVKDSTSPSGFYYKGVPVNADGSPYAGTGKSDGKVQVRQLANGGLEGFNPDTGEVVWRREGDAVAGSGGSGGGSSSRTTTVRSVGSYTPGASGGVTDADYFRANESAQSRAASAAENAAQRQWQAAQNELDRKQRETEMKASLGLQAQSAAQNARDRFVSAISSTDPGAYAAMLATQGGQPSEWTPSRMLGMGQTALSQRLLDAQNAQLAGVRAAQAQAQALGVPVDTSPIVPLMAEGGTIFDSMFGMNAENPFLSAEEQAQLGKPEAPRAPSRGGVGIAQGSQDFVPYNPYANQPYIDDTLRANPAPAGYVPAADQWGRMVYNPNAPGNLKYMQYTPPDTPAPTTPVTRLTGPEGYSKDPGIPDWFEQYAFERGVVPTREMLTDFLNGQSVGVNSGAYNARHGINMQVQRDENGNIRLDADGKPMYQGAARREWEPNWRADPMTMVDPATGKAPLQLLQESAPGFDWWGTYGNLMNEQQMAMAGDWWGSGAPQDPLRSERDAWLALLLSYGANPFGFNGPGGTVLGDPSASPVFQRLQENAYAKASAAWDDLVKNVRPDWDHSADAVQRYYQRNPGTARSLSPGGDYASLGNLGRGGTWDGYVPASARSLLPDGPQTAAARDMYNAPATYTDASGATWYVDPQGRLRRSEQGDAASGGLPGNGTAPGQTYDQAVFRAGFYIDPKTGQTVPKAPNSWPPGYVPKVQTKAGGGQMLPGMAIVGDPKPGSSKPNPEMVIAPAGAQVVPLRELGLGMADVRAAQRKGGMTPGQLGLGQSVLSARMGKGPGGVYPGMRMPMRAEGGPIFGAQDNPWLGNPSDVFNSEPPPTTGGPLPVYDPPPSTTPDNTGFTPATTSSGNTGGSVPGLFPGWTGGGGGTTTGGGGGTTTSTPPPGTGGTGSGDVGDIRGSVTVPDINPFDLRWDFIDPAVRAQWVNARKTKFGIPEESSQFEPLRWRIPGLNRSGVAVGV